MIGKGGGDVMSRKKNVSYPANVEVYGELLIMPAIGRWDLTRRLKG